MVISNEARELVGPTILECQYNISSNWPIKMSTNFHYEIFQIDNAKSHVQYDMRSMLTAFKFYRIWRKLPGDYDYEVGSAVTAVPKKNGLPSKDSNRRVNNYWYFL